MCTFTNRRLLPTYLWPGENGCNARVREPADALNTSDTGDSLKQSTILTTAANHLFITLAVSLAESVKHWSGVCLFCVGPSVLFGKNWQFASTGTVCGYRGGKPSLQQAYISALLSKGQYISYENMLHKVKHITTIFIFQTNLG